VYFRSLFVGLALLDQSLAWHFVLVFEFIGAANSRIADSTAAPPSADYGKEIETGYWIRINSGGY
jgi:hypothetical protein